MCVCVCVYIYIYTLWDFKKKNITQPAVERDGKFARPKIVLLDQRHFHITAKGNGLKVVIQISNTYLLN